MKTTIFGLRRKQVIFQYGDDKVLMVTNTTATKRSVFLKKSLVEIFLSKIVFLSELNFFNEDFLVG